MESEVRALKLEDRHPTARATPPVNFALVIMEIGLGKLFTLAGLKTPFSRSQLLK
jgi:hypothetical protein